MSNTWLKLNGNWMESDWLIVLSAEARLAWVQLLCYVKTHGTYGQVKAKSAIVFARQNFIGEEAVEQMIRAAKLDGALEEKDGEWIVTGWAHHQGDSTNAERQRRFRERQKQVQNKNRNALRNARTEQNRTEENNNPPLSPKGEKPDFDGAGVPEGLIPIMETLLDWQGYQRERRHPWKRKTWETNFRKYACSPDEFKARIEQSIEMGWQGLFDPRDGPKQPRGNSDAWEVVG